MMNFKTLNKFQIVVGIIIFSVMSLLSAEVTVNSSEKNDKVVSSSTSVPEVSKGWLFHAEQWELARSGESILSLPVLNKVINIWLQDKDKQIEIQYPGGEEGEFWVQQLSDWLVSLGVPSDRMVTVPGSGADDVIKFALIK